jgi:hypothetical protein
MRQWIRSHLTYANVMVTIVAFIVLGGVSYAATGGNFILGKSNSASSTTSLTAPVAGKGLQVTNTSTGAGATALGLNVASGHAPFTVNSGTKVKGLNADTLDGKDSASFVSTSNLRQVGPVTMTLPNNDLQQMTIATVGHFTFTGLCARNLGGGGVDSVDVLISTDVDHSTFGSMSQAPSGPQRAGDMLVSGGSYDVFFDTGTATGNQVFHPASGSAVAPDGQQVGFDLYEGMNDRNQPGECIFGGTFAVK